MEQEEDEEKEEQEEQEEEEEEEEKEEEQEEEDEKEQEIAKTKKVLTPKSKIEEMVKNPNQSRELVKKAVFGEVLQMQITEMISKAKTYQEKSHYQKLLSGPIVQKYKLWRLRKSTITYKKIRHNSSTKKNEN
ncbi:hypothetical protein FQA39_LY08985 [Lamprigera yunnana]|nr:hypothetical protein FQA39_LY08985 [Lamprigera yunnana]